MTKPILLLAILLGLATFFGCNSESELSLAKYNKTNIKRLRSAYGLFEASHGRGPKSQKELKEFLKTDKATEIRLERIGVTQDMVDDIFVSERDGQPFKVRYGVTNQGDDAIVFEAEGVDEKRMVAFYEPRELNASEYEAFWAGKKKGEKIGATVETK